jgi:hypothetical protein
MQSCCKSCVSDSPTRFPSTRIKWPPSNQGNAIAGSRSDQSADWQRNRASDADVKRRCRRGGSNPSCGEVPNALREPITDDRLDDEV